MNEGESLVGKILEEAPEVYEQALYWGTIENWIGVGVGILLLLAAGVIAVAYFKKFRHVECEDKKLFFVVACTILSLLFLVVAATIIPCAITGLIKIKQAPKLYVVERLMKSLRR